MFKNRSHPNHDVVSCHAMRQKQHDQVMRWAQELINNRGNPLYQKALRNFLKRNPSGLEELSPHDRERLWRVLNDKDSSNDKDSNTKG